jgi:hypothetical protein
MERIVDLGIPVLIAPDASKRRGARPGWDGGLYAFMRRVLATEHGGGLYRQRQPMIEPVFGQTKHNRGIERFQRRGRADVRTEWRLITATDNLLKLHRHTLAAARNATSGPRPRAIAAASRRPSQSTRRGPAIPTDSRDSLRQLRKRRRRGRSRPLVVPSERLAGTAGDARIRGRAGAESRS